MGESDDVVDWPAPGNLAPVFDVYEVRTDGETVLYVGEPRADRETVERELWPLFRGRGYDPSLRQGYDAADDPPLTAGEYVLVAEPQSAGGGVPWRNVVLFALTVLSTLFAGSFYWYHIPVTEQPLRMLEAWPFVVAIMGVLGVHELGHYVMSRYHGVDASLPYFIPLPTYIGSMGAVIRMRGRIPNRKALFDIGVAGPLAGLVATAIVTVVGLQLDPLPAQQAAAAATDTARVEFNNPTLLWLLAELSGTAGKLESGLVHPVVFGGWVGMLVTLLNLLPVGQLDGGHILRAMVGDRQETLAAAVPGALFALAGYLLFVREGVNSVGIWAMWGLFAVGLAYAGPATPIHDEPLDRTRIAVGVLTFVLGVLCFTPVPVEVIPA
ncbi:MAG: site-2 protease family protein [Haloarculaceae archaeon]